MVTSKKVSRTVIENGLTILFAADHKLPKVSSQLWYNVGSKDEMSGERGIAHLIEHMIFKGTKTLSESDINLITSKLSGYVNAFTSYDYTGYLFDFPSANWQHGLTIMADCMVNCTFKEDLLTSELKAVIQELKMYKDYYSASLIEELISSIFYDHPYQHPIIGYKQDLWTLKRDNLISFYKKHYIPNNATLVVVGDTDEQEVIAAARNYFGHIKPDAGYTKESFYHRQDLNSKSVTLYRDISQPIGLVAFVIPGSRAKIDFLTDIFSWIIASGKGSRLYKKLVDQLELVTEIEAFTYDMFDYSLLCIYFTPKILQDIQKVVDIINQELVTISCEEFTEKEITRAIKKARVDYLSLLESNQKKAGIIGKSYLATQDENYVFTYLDHTPATLPGELQEFAQQYLRPCLMHTGSILPLPESEHAYWLSLQELSDKEDMRILSKSVRSSPVEDGDQVRTIMSPSGYKFTFPKPQKITLPNGLEVLYHQNAGTGKIDLILEFRANHYYDPDGKEGLSGFVSEMLTEGSQGYPGSKLSEELESNGIVFNASPGVITMSMLAQDVTHGCELLLEILTRATFEEGVIEKVRSKIIADIKNYWDNPAQFAEQVVREQIYKDSPMKKGSLGSLEGILSITREDLVGFYTRYFSPHKSKLAIVGDVSVDVVNDVVQKTVGMWHGPEVPLLTYPDIQPIKAHTIDYPINRDQIVLCFAGKSLARADKQFDSLLILDQIFTGGALGSMNSRLFQLREQYGLFYTIGGSLLAYSGEHQGIVFIKTIVSCDSVDQAEQKITEVIDKGSRQVTADEVAEAKNAIISSLIDNFESNRQIASAFLFIARYGFADDFFDQRAHQLAQISQREVEAVGALLLNSKHMIKVKIGRTQPCTEK